ncbi:MAG: condensation domain-containing protein, partial [Acidobacteria bacterium]|nr:condensation domain-containing protein [Acidobacteriota bacterium]
ASFLITKETISNHFSFTTLANICPENNVLKPIVTSARPQVKDFDRLPIPDRSLVDYEKYHRYIGEALARHTITIQATRGCPFKCAFCHKIWPKTHVYRSAQHIFNEVKKLYDIGARRFVFVDDIFNLNRENSGRFFELIIENGLKVQLFFTNGLRGDILTEEFIDLMVAAGTVDFDFSLESASPRIQRLMGKNLDIHALKKTIDYIAAKHPQVIIELQTMLGFPTETEEEALVTLEFIKSLRWVDFPYVHFLRIFPGSDMEKIAIENGISREAILRSANLAYHEYSETLPFSKEFAKLYQTRFFNEYFLLKERFLTVLKKQIKLLSAGELIQKYDSFFPTEIKDLDMLLATSGITGIDRAELNETTLLPEDYLAVPDVNHKMKAIFPPDAEPSGPDALRILLLDLSQFFSHEAETLYDVVEVPLGLMYLLTYLKEQYGPRIHGKIAKARIDFDSYGALNTLLQDFKPDLIGIRTLNYYKDFFHKTVSLVRQWGIDVPIVAGGPYATTSYTEILLNPGVDLVVLGEGELTFAELVGEILANNGCLPAQDTLKTIQGIAYRDNTGSLNAANRQIIFMDNMAGTGPIPGEANPENINKPTDLAYIVYTSGTTGKPKGVLVEHRNVAAYIDAFSRRVPITPGSTIIQQASFSFDTYVEEVFAFLLNGGKIALPGKYDVLDTALISDFLTRYNVDAIDCAPLLLNQLNRLPLTALPARLKTFISGGDVLKRSYIDNLLGHGEVYNSYGPTETTICATFYHCQREDEDEEDKDNGNVPIGTPLPGYRVFILGLNNRLLPPGVPGELCISGRGVARGYLNNPELTNDKFLLPSATRGTFEKAPLDPPKLLINNHSPLTTHHSPIYKTGDLARRLADGNIEFMGRIDQQVKIRGFRIEPAEIEHKLLNYQAIIEAAVVVKENQAPGKYICAYFAAQKELNVKELRQWLSTELPEFMIPAQFVQLEKLPITHTGKVNRDLLSRMAGNALALGGEYAAPGTNTEKRMVNIWQEVFPGREIGIDDNFFELGGNSLLAIRTTAQIRAELGLEIPLKTLFEHPTIRELARSAAINKEEIPVIEKVPRGECGYDEYIPLSFSQERLWFLQELDAGNVAYFVPRVIRLKGILQTVLVERTFHEIIRRHEILRTVFPLHDGKPVQQILAASAYPFKITVIDWSTLGQEEREQRTGAFLNEEGRRPFDFEHGPLLRVTLLKLAEAEHLFVLTEHHLVHDGWTQGVLLKEFITIFSAYAEGRNHDLPELPIQYADYTIWQRTYLQGERLQRGLDYWQEKLAGLAPVLEFPGDRPRPAVMSGQGALQEFHVPAALSRRLDEFSRENGVTLFMTMLAVFKILLYRCTGKEDLCVGTGTANRGHKEMEGMLGMVINTLPLRTQLNEEISFKECLGRVKETCLEAYRYEDTPFGKIVAVLQPERSLSYSPLFQVVFAFMDTPGGELKLPGLELELLPSHNRSSKFDINIVVTPPRGTSEPHETSEPVANAQGAGELQVECEYNTDIFDQATIMRLISHYRNLLAAGPEQPGTKISILPLLTEAEMNRVLYEFNDTEMIYPREKSIHRLFAEQAQKIPDHIAAVGQSI